VDQPPLDEVAPDSAIESRPLPFLPAETAGGEDGEAFVAVVRDLPQFSRWLQDAPPELQWIQVENLLGEPEAWSTAARVGDEVPLDVVMSDPATEHPLLYRLVDVRSVRPVRVTIPVQIGFSKALRLAAAIQLPVRLSLAQPDREALNELGEALDFYLRDPMVEAPVEFFHSALGGCTGSTDADLWIALECDPAVFQHFGADGRLLLPAGWPELSATGFVDEHLAGLDRDGAPCTSCGWRDFCRGYFKLPDPDYSCEGIISLLDRLAGAAAEIKAELGEPDPNPNPGNPTSS